MTLIDAAFLEFKSAPLRFGWKSKQNRVIDELKWAKPFGIEHFQYSIVLNGINDIIGIPEVPKIPKCTTFSVIVFFNIQFSSQN